mmetsp:Transcript_91903/g.259600  ORF Transcript_91903/g.259600 Transcript_91903/m.259600 type:complete len:212 (-) Transcript_91903:122-757(-)
MALGTRLAHVIEDALALAFAQQGGDGCHPQVVDPPTDTAVAPLEDVFPPLITRLGPSGRHLLTSLAVGRDGPVINLEPFRRRNQSYWAEDFLCRNLASSKWREIQGDHFSHLRAFPADPPPVAMPKDEEPEPREEMVYDPSPNTRPPLTDAKEKSVMVPPQDKNLVPLEGSQKPLPITVGANGLRVPVAENAGQIRDVPRNLPHLPPRHLV